MGDRATLRMARQQLEDLYLQGVPDDSVDLTFKDLPSPAAAFTKSNATAASDDGAGGSGDDGDKKKTNPQAVMPLLLARSTTNIFAYKMPADQHDQQEPVLDDHAGFELSPPRHQYHNDDDDDEEDQLDQHKKKQQRHNNNHTTSTSVVTASKKQLRRASNYKRPGIPHSNVCARCNAYVYLFRHRCLVCGRVYCRRCVGAGMGDMTEGRKCIDCLGRRYSHRYIHKAGTKLNAAGCGCFWGYYPDAKAVKAQELAWAEKGPAPRRRPRPSNTSTSISTSTSTSYGASGYYSSSNTLTSASMSMTMGMSSTNNNMTKMVINGANSASTPASSSFVASFSPNPHAFPL